MKNMKKIEICLLLSQILSDNPSLCKDVAEMTDLLRKTGKEAVDEKSLDEFLKKHPALDEVYRKALIEDQKAKGLIFPVREPFSKEMLERIETAGRDEHKRTWAQAMKALPEYTLPLSVVDKAFIERGRKIWADEICGNEEVFKVILRHCAEYHKTGKTMPILLVGDPGIGKTLIAKNYSRIMNLPFSFVSGPSAVFGRGLSGAPNLYIGAGPGVIVQSMIDKKAGNPLILLDELEKTIGGHSESPHIQNELLSLLDESSEMWFDNFLETSVDASHIPLIFTANDDKLINGPLLDRMEVVRVSNPGKEMINTITRDFLLPKVLRSYSCDRIIFREDELEKMVDMLWLSGNKSLRAYKKAVDLLVSDAFLRAMEEESEAVVTEADIRSVLSACDFYKKSGNFGFVGQIQ